MFELLQIGSVTISIPSWLLYVCGAFFGLQLLAVAFIFFKVLRRMMR